MRLRTTYPVAFAAAMTLAACGQQKTAASGIEARPPAPAYTDITAVQLHDMMQKKDFLLINVHIPYAGDIPGTDASIPYDQIAAQLDRLPADKASKVVVYCRSGNMSKTASATLVSMGYTNIFNVAGGMRAWTDAGYLLEQRGRP